MFRNGTVARIEGKHIIISTVPLEACCGTTGASGKCCGAGKAVEFRALNPKNLDLTVGDYVEVTSSPSKQGLGLLQVFIIPGLLGLAAWMGAAHWGKVENTSFLALAALAGFFGGLGLNAVLFKSNDSGLPVVSKIIPVMDISPLSV